MTDNNMENSTNEYENAEKEVNQNGIDENGNEHHSDSSDGSHHHSHHHSSSGSSHHSHHHSSSGSSHHSHHHSSSGSSHHSHHHSSSGSSHHSHHHSSSDNSKKPFSLVEYIKKKSSKRSMTVVPEYRKVSRRVVFCLVLFAFIALVIVDMVSPKDETTNQNASYTRSEADQLRLQITNLQLENSELEKELELYKKTFGELEKE